MKTFTIEYRRMLLVNTDPQRRCYDGCHFSSEWIWSAWTVLETGLRAERIESRLTFWRELNYYAVSQRGEKAKEEFRKVEDVTIKN